MLVGRHAYTITAAAYQYAHSCFSFGHHSSYRVCKIRIVNTVEAVCAFIIYLPAGILQCSFECFFIFEACVVCAYGQW